MGKDRQAMVAAGKGYHLAFNAEEEDDSIKTINQYMANMAASNSANDARIESLEAKIESLTAAL